MKKTGLILLLLGSLLQLSCADSEGQGKVQVEHHEQEQEQVETISEEKAVFRTSPDEVEDVLQQKTSENGFFQQEELQKFYSNRNYKPAWEDEDQRESLFSALVNSEAEGLPFDYHQEKISQLREKELKGTNTAELDILLSDAFLQYAHDLYYGRLDPAEIYKVWGVKRKKIDLQKALGEGLENSKLAEALEELKPQHEIYADLKTALKEYEPEKEQQSKTRNIPEGELIKPGEQDARIPAIAARLQEKDFQVLKRSKNDSLYSEDIQAAVKEFQKERGLQTDGIVGNSTIQELNMSPKDRYHQILVNLERWRWYPRDLGEHYILINVANFRLAVVKDGDTVRTHRVVAGSRTRQTPTFSDTIQYIVINPEWHIPSSIATQEVIPQASKDPNYLNSRNMKVYANDGQIAPSNIDWSSSQTRSYRFVQSAGPANPLGRVKIIYPNKYLIYLHDTPAQSLFGRNQRAASHGCVRVENAVGLAGYVVDAQDDWNEDKIREIIDSGKTTKVKIHQPIQVHHFYWTTWRDGGKTVFAPDVYDLDKKIYTKLLEN